MSEWELSVSTIGVVIWVTVGVVASPSAVAGCATDRLRTRITTGWLRGVLTKLDHWWCFVLLFFLILLVTVAS